MLHPFRKAKAAPRTATAAAPSVPPARAAIGKLEAKGGVRRFIGLIQAPHRTEKTSQGAAHRWYAFRVADGATKPMVRAAVEERYGVRVERVRIVAPRAKSIRLGRIRGQTPGFRKAMVRLAAGDSLKLA